jgi:cytochrome c-type biogenesis protein CcmH/NrfG
VVLARVNLRDNNKQAANDLLERALRLEPGNAEALALKQKADGKATVLPASVP